MPLGQIRIIGGKWRGRRIQVMDHADLRPTSDRVRETLFNWLLQDVREARCLDLFAGTGALGIEALSRGASFVTFIENYSPAFKALKETLGALQAQDQSETLFEDSLRWLQLPFVAKPYDLIFLDPPFASSLLDQSLSLLAQHPCVKEQTLIYIEAAKDQILSFPPNWSLLKHKTTQEVGYYLLQGGSS